MVDFKVFGNLAILLGTLSVMAWWRVLLAGQRQESPLPRQPREPNSWPRGAPLRAFVAAFVVPIFVQLLLHFFAPVVPGEPPALPVNVEATSENTPVAKSEEQKSDDTKKIAPPAAKKSDEKSNNRLVALLCVTTLVQIVTVVFMLTLETGTSQRKTDFGLGTLPWPQGVRIGVLGFLASLLPVYAVNLLVHALGWHDPNAQHKLVEILQGGGSGFALVGAAVLATILAPLTEELMYRVTLQEGLEKFVPGNASIWLTALLFAGVHSVNGRPDALPLLPLALILGYVYRQTHSYVAVFTLHALFNGLTVIMTRVAPPG